MYDEDGKQMLFAGIMSLMENRQNRPGMQLLTVLAWNLRRIFGLQRLNSGSQ